MRASWLCLAAAALASGCANDWRTDMWYQASVRPQSAPRLEPEGSIALGAEPRYRGRDATVDVQNPIPATSASVARGQALFVSRCLPCHGADGHGIGPVSRLFPQPADLTSRTVRSRTDGFIWGQVTFGGDAMPPAGEGLDAPARWDLVNFVRAMQEGRAPPP
jgi:mono/diheme cytochrome c family protein